MKQKFVYGAISLCLALLGLSFILTSCKDSNESASWDDSVVGTATVSGVVMDTFDNPLSDVTVSCKGTDTRREVRKTGASGSDGAFSISDVPSNARYITFSKDGFATVAYTIEAGRFTDEDNIVLNPVLEFSQAVITGTVIDASTGKPYAGVQVSSGSVSSSTDENGVFKIEGLTLNDYTLTFATADGTNYSRPVSLSDFVDGMASVPTVRLGGNDVFPSLKWQDLYDSQVWYANDYRGSTGFGGINDWSCGYLSAMPYSGYFRYEAEGCAFEIRNTGHGSGWSGNTDEGDEDNLNAFMFGRKSISSGNKILSVLVRTHNAAPANPARFGLQVLDFTSGASAAVKVGDVKTHASGDYSSYSFDMSQFVGHDIAFAFGVYFYKGTSGYHLPIRRMCFASTAVSGDDYLGGTPVTGISSDWKMTVENASSMAVNPGTTFTGLNLGMSSDDARRTHNPGGQQGYSPWLGSDHLMMSWALMYLHKDVEPVNGEGYTIKTRSGVEKNYASPETYIYSRFNISSANDQMTMRVRTFSGSVPTVFRVTVISESGSAAAIAPVSNTAAQASAVDGGNGCWKFIHDKGAGDPAEYAAFTYDFSSYKGQNVVIAVSVHKGETSDGEQKLCFYGIEME